MFSIVFPYVWWISQACWLSLGSLGPSGTSLQDSSIPRPLQDLNSFGSPAQHHAAFKHMRLMKMFKSDHMLINMSCMYCTCLILFVSICNIYIYIHIYMYLLFSYFWACDFKSTWWMLADLQPWFHLRQADHVLLASQSAAPGGDCRSKASQKGWCAMTMTGSSHETRGLNKQYPWAKIQFGETCWHWSAHFSTITCSGQ